MNTCVHYVAWLCNSCWKWPLYAACMLMASVRTYTWTQSDTFNVLHWSTLSRLKRHHSSTRHCLLLFLLFIINVLIKVTLNVIRCRGTLQSQWSKLTDSTSRKAEKDVNVLDGRHCQSCATSIELEHEKCFIIVLHEEDRMAMSLVCTGLD